jgi:hypothetical protein
MSNNCYKPILSDVHAYNQYIVHAFIYIYTFEKNDTKPLTQEKWIDGVYNSMTTR